MGTAIEILPFGSTMRVLGYTPAACSLVSISRHDPFFLIRLSWDSMYPSFQNSRYHLLASHQLQTACNPTSQQFAMSGWVECGAIE
jgi:hypothetical protein